MATIAEHTQDLIDSLRRGREAIIGRGGTIAPNAGFADFPTAIYNIPADNAITTVVDDTSASVKSVPTNSTRYAYLAELGGMTYRDEETDTLVYTKATEVVSKGITYPIPAEVQALEGYGEGISATYCNKVDFENKKYIRRCYRVIADGVNTRFTYTTTESGYRYFSLGVGKAPLSNSNRVLCSHLEYGAFKFQPGYCYILPSQRSVVCFLQDQTITSIDDANAWAKQQYESGTPFEVLYIANTSEATDLPVEFNALIEVEGGGTIEFVNEYGYAVPSKVIYQTLTQ